MQYLLIRGYDYKVVEEELPIVILNSHDTIFSTTNTDIYKYGEEFIIKVPKFANSSISRFEYSVYVFLCNKNIPVPKSILVKVDGKFGIKQEKMRDDLFEFLKYAKLNRDAKIDLSLQILKILMQIHQLKLVHNDIKAENFLYDNGQIFIIDFLTVRCYNDCGRVVGTKLYFNDDLKKNHLSNSKINYKYYNDIYAVIVLIAEIFDLKIYEEEEKTKENMFLKLTFDDLSFHDFDKWNSIINILFTSKTENWENGINHRLLISLLKILLKDW